MTSKVKTTLDAKIKHYEKDGYTLFKTGVGEKAMKNACYNCEDSHYNATVTYVTGDKKGKDVEWAVLYTMAF
jgi:hypothetical protein